MTQASTGWRRDRDKMKTWEHRGKVVFAGIGHSPCDRRWDGKTMETTLGARSVLAARLAMEDAGVTPDQIDGVIGSMHTEGGPWGPRPYFAPPYDSEDGLTKVSAEWLTKQSGLPNVKYTYNDQQLLGDRLGLAVQAVGDGLCNTCLVLYAMSNVPGRYLHGGENASDYAPGPSQFKLPWGYHSGAMLNCVMVFQQYCRKYGTSRERIAPFAINQRRNGLMVPWGYYSLYEPYQITKEDYLNSRFVAEPLSVADCDRPVNAAGCYIITTAERARDMKQKPVYVLNHSEGRYPPRSTMATLEEHQAAAASAARRVYDSSGIGPQDIDVFNPYDGYLLFTQQFLEAFQWRGVKLGEAHDFYAGDITVEGPNPFLSSGGNSGVGHIRNSTFMDSIEQIRGTAGPRQVRTRCEIAVSGLDPVGTGGWIVFGKNPD